MTERRTAQERAAENALIASAREKARSLRAADIDPFPHSYPGVERIADVAATHAELPPGSDSDARHRVAGRLTARRDQGRGAWLDLVDRSGRIQLNARANVLDAESYERLLSLDLGDIVGVDGVAFRSRRGELTLLVAAFELLAKSLRPPPDKHHGLRDVETRYRSRELDLMANEEARALFTLRSAIVRAVRRELDDDGFLEVETPILQPLYGGAAARPFVTHHNALDMKLYLRIAMELYLKRCIVGGLERVYELGRDFRNEGISHKHNPEFTMIEWYEAYADYHDTAARCERLVHAVAQSVGYDGELDFTPPWRRVTLAGAIAEHTGIDILDNRDTASLSAAMRARDLEVPADETWPQLVDHLLSKHVEPTLIQPTFVMDYPVEMSPFAKQHRTEPGLVERFEGFAAGMELCNAFTELNDPEEQQRRFEEQRLLASAGDEEAQPYDEAFIRALEHGMPPTGGIGIGIDRLVLLLSGRSTLRDVILFPAMRPEQDRTPDG